MVNQSDPPFRTLCLKYGASCAYTEMLYSSRIVNCYGYLENRLQEIDHTFFLKDKRINNENEISSNTNKYDSNNGSSGYDQTSTYRYQSRPLIVQICGNDSKTLSECMLRLIEHNESCPIDAIDFNLGCPQDRAKEGLYGSYLLDKCHWPLVFECVQAMTSTLSRRLES
jgi:tRNA-dihydrouridine synthase 1